MAKSHRRARLLTAAALAFACAAPAAVQAQQRADGVLTAVWGDPHPSLGGAAELRWLLTDDAGRDVPVAIDEALLRRLGGVRALDRRRVSVTGALLDPPGPEGPTLFARELDPLTPTAVPQLGSRAFAILLCRFADVEAEPRPRTDFEQLMGDAYPNLGHFYGEMSGGQLDFTGTRVFGWFALPLPKSAYFSGTAVSSALARLSADCTAAADAAVDFTEFDGIITQFNSELAETGLGNAWGGARRLRLDGADRDWPFVWMPLWATQSGRFGVYAHEIGHALGLAHSSGPYELVYDSRWDVMSNAYLLYDPSLAAWLPGHTIAHHKDLLGWIPDARRQVVSGPAPQSLEVEQSQNRGAGTGPLIVVVPIPGTRDFYTVEARRQVGYDAALPGSAVIIHRVPDPKGTSCTANQCARVVDSDNNGNPNDAGAMWLPGEVFDDGRGIRISVDSAAANGWHVTVTPGVLLSVGGAGTGAGRVRTQGRTDIDCSITAAGAGGACRAAFYGYPTVTLTATPDANGTFAGWSGACTGTGACIIAIDGEATVTATFTAAPVRPATLTAARAADAITGRGTLTAEEREYLDQIGNRNGRLDIGDLLALLRQK